MKRIAVISDTHDVLRPQVIKLVRSCDVVIHAGDFTQERILDALRNEKNVYVVRGNNDGAWAHHLRNSLRFTIGGLRFFLTHDRRDIDRNLDDIDIVIFGHSHQYYEKRIQGRLWLNPGACGRSRFGGELTAAVLTIDEETLTYIVEKVKIEM